MSDTDTKQIPYGTRVKYNALTGTVIDPEEPGRGEPYRGSRPPYPTAWVYLDSRHHHTAQQGFDEGARAPGHGFWVRLDDPALEILPPETTVKVGYHDFETGQLVRITYQEGGVETIQTGVVTVEGGSVRLGDKDRFGERMWVDWDRLDSIDVISQH